MASEELLTPEQIQNWRRVMVGMLGPYALIMSDEDVQRMRDKMQEWCNEAALTQGKEGD